MGKTIEDTVERRIIKGKNISEAILKKDVQEGDIFRFTFKKGRGFVDGLVTEIKYKGRYRVFVVLRGRKNFEEGERKFLVKEEYIIDKEKGVGIIDHSLIYNRPLLSPKINPGYINYDEMLIEAGIKWEKY